MRRLLEPVRRWFAEPRIGPGMGKAYLVGLGVLALGIPVWIATMPYIEFFNDLAVQDKVRPQMVWKSPGGQRLMSGPGTPPEAVPRERSPYPFWFVRRGDSEEEKRREAQIAATAGEALTAGNEAIPPEYRRPRATLELVRRGKEVYENHCIVCHGPTGAGDGPVVARGFPAPPSLLAPKARAYPDGRIFHVVTVGQNRVMPSYAASLEPRDRWAVVFYVRALQLAYGESGGEGNEEGGAR
jgi:mono/diheme cytochrome c family protein